MIAKPTSAMDVPIDGRNWIAPNPFVYGVLRDADVRVEIPTVLDMTSMHVIGEQSLRSRRFHAAATFVD